MSVAAFLEELRSRDIQVWPDGDQLRCNAPAGVLTPDLRDVIKQRKRDIVEFLRTAESVARQQKAIVPLQAKGKRIPIFAVPGHNGDVFQYRALAQLLGDDQPIFGLEPPGLEGETKPLQSVEELAAYFAEQIRAFYGGPCVIAGYCAGGATAFELAQQLGSQVEFTIMFAGAYPTWYGLMPQRYEQIALRVKRGWRHIENLNFKEIKSRFVSHWRAAAPGGADEIATRQNTLKKITATAVHRYQPREFKGRLIQVVPSKTAVIAGSPTLQWRRFAPQMEVFYGPDRCEGDVMLLEPHASASAAIFRACRDFR